MLLSHPHFCCFQLLSFRHHCCGPSMLCCRNGQGFVYGALRTLCRRPLVSSNMTTKRNLRENQFFLGHLFRTELCSPDTIVTDASSAEGSQVTINTSGCFFLFIIASKSAESVPNLHIAPPNCLIIFLKLGANAHVQPSMMS